MFFAKSDKSLNPKFFRNSFTLLKIVAAAILFRLSAPNYFLARVILHRLLKPRSINLCEVKPTHERQNLRFSKNFTDNDQGIPILMFFFK